MIILIVFIALSILILGHEFGHFLLAKLFGVRVDEFGIGYPPRLFGKKFGETLYSVNALPFGGFVKIPGEDGAHEGEDKEKNADNSEVIYEEIEEKEISVGGGIIERICSIKLLEIIRPKRLKNRSFAAQPAWKRAVVLTGGIGMNLVLGWTVLSAVFMVGMPKHLIVLNVAKDSPAAAAGLKAQDIILRAEYKGTVLKDPIETDAFIAFVKSAEGNEFAVQALRGTEKIDVTAEGRINPPEGQGPLGVGLASLGFGKEPFFKSFASGFSAMIDMTAAVAVGIATFFASIFAGGNALQAVSGPVGIFSFIAGAGETLGIVYLLQIVALVSINLAIMNLIPFPALDGGRLLFLLIEKIKGSPVPRRVQAATNAVGFLALIALMVVVTVKDVAKLIN